MEIHYRELEVFIKPSAIHCIKNQCFMAVDSVINGGDNRDDDYIILEEQKPIPAPDPTKVLIPPCESGQAEACNDFAPPKPDTFDV